MSVYSIYIEKKPNFATEATTLLGNLTQALELKTITNLRIINRYLVENIDEKDLQLAIHTVLSHPRTDMAYVSMPNLKGAKSFGIEALPLQYDQRADSAAQGIALATGKERPLVRTGKIYVLEGDISEKELLAVKKYMINPVESKEMPNTIPESIERITTDPGPVPRLTGFTTMTSPELEELRKSMGIAMDLDDMLHCQNYFANTEHREPTDTEIRMLDTYWSDHCRHTTFFTELDELTIQDDLVKKAGERYFALREKLYTTKKRPVTLMDLATIGARALKAEGILTDIEESEEVNACSVTITVDVDGEDQNWLLMFKNETHNHPTEIEPFGGASTCLGGAIRDPLSGRGYVYQAMRIIGAGNPTEPVKDTLTGKLPQRTLAQTAARGYSSYGNQIGAATGLVNEIYHKGYVAKRMELGALVAAAPADYVVREVPAPGDVVLLVGGRTGKDGVGGATGSSVAHTEDSVEEGGSEVQKGNPAEERKIVRLFRKPEISKMIKRCNDFGAGGVSVSISELADGITINLDVVPTKYGGMSGTEVAISESQERMSVVVSAENAKRFIELSNEENLESTIVAEITEKPRLVMHWKGDTIVDLSREFLDTSGVTKHTKATITKVSPWVNIFAEESNAEEITSLLGSLEHAGQKGLLQNFDTTAGATTVILPYGGTYQLTPAQAMVAKIPVIGETNTASVMGWGFNPVISQHSPYHGATLAVVDSVARMLASGGSRKKSWLTFQEYFERLGDDATRWGKPAAALLGALDAQMELGIGSVGGKDSMSGSFEELDVPPTLVSFAVSVAKASKVVSGEFKKAGSPVYLLQPKYSDELLPEYESLRQVFDQVEALIEDEKISAIYTVGTGGTSKAIPMMSFGNHIGFRAEKGLSAKPTFGSFIIEAKQELPKLAGSRLGTTIEAYQLVLPKEAIELGLLENTWLKTAETVFPIKAKAQKSCEVEKYTYETTSCVIAKQKIDIPKVVILSLPGSHGEYELEYGFTKAGAAVNTYIVRNAVPEEIQASVKEFARLVRESQILAIPGGMTGGGEPDGSGRFIVAFLQHTEIREAITDLIENREGLVLGIGEGFSALLQLGLLPSGKFQAIDQNTPVLTDNLIGRHQSQMVRVRISTNKSPWLCHLKVGEVYTLPISTGQGRFVANESQFDDLAENGQIAGQYVNLEDNPTKDITYNPTGSDYAIEGLVSPDGRIYGRMSNPERSGNHLYKNISGNKEMNIFQGAVDYFRK